MTTASRRSDAGFWSSAKSFFLPVGPHIDPDGVRGYPIDMRVKARTCEPAPESYWSPASLHVAVTQYALACHEHWLAGGGDAWLDIALETGRRLAAIQSADGSWYHERAFPHTFRLPPPWASGITQGQAASLFVRLYEQSAEDVFVDAAHRALRPLATPQADGGVLGELGGLPWPEEYPTSPQSHVLNGAIFAMWGMRDVAVGLGDGDAKDLFSAHLNSLVVNLPRYDTGSWSLYSLFPHLVRNRSSSFYHGLVVNQLTAMQQIAPRAEFAAMRERWDRYADSRRSQATSFAWKATFRIIVPRNPRLARSLPWSRL